MTVTSPLTTTCIGAYPKPPWSPISDWFQASTVEDMGGATTRQHNRDLAALDRERAALLDRATTEAVADQIACGVDVPTDGEQRRENYVHYHCRHIAGFDFEDLTRRSMRDDAYVSEVPTVRARLAAAEPFLVEDWHAAQVGTDRPVKMTVPGPLTIMGTTADAHYLDDRALALDLAAAINEELLSLTAAGCTQVQVDEPVFAREPDRALAFGMDALDRTLAGLPDGVVRSVHLCCGYPGHLDDDAYQKADPAAYRSLAPFLDALDSVDQVSIEDAHRHNDLTLLESFTTTSVIFGSVAIAQSRVADSSEIATRLRHALDHIDRDRLLVAPDCGLGFLSRDLAMAKLREMTAAAAMV